MEDLISDDHLAATSGAPGAAIIKPKYIPCKSKGKYVSIKQKQICVLLNNLDKISVLFDAKLVHIGGYRNTTTGKKYLTFQAIPCTPDVDSISLSINIQASNKSDFSLLIIYLEAA